MNLADLDALVKMLQDPTLREAMAHPDWDNAYAALVKVQDDQVEGFFDLDDDVQFLHILNKMEFSVQDGVLMSDEYEWKDGEWTC